MNACGAGLLLCCVVVVHRRSQEGSKADQQGEGGAQQADTAAPDVGAEEQQSAASAAAATPCRAADASTQTSVVASAPLPLGEEPTQLPAAADGVVPQHDGVCHVPQVCGSLAAAAGELQAAAAAAPASCSTPGSKRRRHVQGGRERTPPCMGGAADAQQPMSPFRQLRVHTHALRAEPHNMQVAIEQRTLLQQQIAATGLVMQQRQLEQQLEAVKQQLQEVQKGRETSGRGADVISRLGSPAHPDQCCSPVLDLQQQGQPPAAWSAQPSKQSRLAQGGGGSCSSPQAAAAAQTWLAAAGSSAAFMQHWTPGDNSPTAVSQQQQQEAQAITTSPQAASGAQRAVRANSSSSSTASSAASTPRSSGASSSGDSCTDLLDELSDFAKEVQKLATAAHQASTFKAVSASTLFPLRSSQQLLGPAAAVPDAPAQQLHSVAGSAAVSSTGSPCRLPQQQQGALLGDSPDKLDGGALLDAAAALEADATAKLQADLQVSSAYELAATRGLLHAGAVLRELRSTLVSSKHSGQHKHSRHHAHRDAASTAGRLKSGSRVATLTRSPGAEQRQQGGESPPVARTLFATACEGADADSRAAPAAAAVTGPTGAAVDAAAAAVSDSSPGPQHSAFGVLRQLQQQQQYIIEVLGSLAATQQQQQVLSAGGSPALNPLQQLVDAEQQLQVLLHVVGAVVQDAHASTGGDSLAGGAADSRQQLAALLGPRGSWSGWSQPASLRGSATWASAAAAGGTPDARKLADWQLLHGGSPDQQQQRDSSPDKLRRRQHAWVLPGAAPCLAGQQQPTATSDRAAGAQHGAQVQQHSQQEVERQQVRELTQLRGQVIRLQLELQRAKQQAHVAESLVSASCTSLPGGRRSTSPNHAWLRRSQDSVSTPAGPTTSGVTSAATGASGGSAAGTPAQLVLLSGRNRELQAACMQRDSQVRQLENEVRRLQHELRQQALAAAYPAGGSVQAGGGCLMTPRGAATPRHGGLAGIAGPPSLLSSLSPQRRAASSPGAAGTPRGFSSGGGGAAAAGYAVPAPALGGFVAAGHMPPTRFASGSGGVGQADAHLPAVPECVAHCRQQQQDCLLHDPALDDVSCASTSSSRSRGKGIRVGAGKPPLHVLSLRRN